MDVLTQLIIPGLVAIGTIAVAVLAIWGDWVRAKLAPARLTIEPHTLTGDSAQVIRQADGGIQRREQAYFYHLKIVNKRPWITPRNCRVLLKAMTKRGPDQLFHPIPMSVPGQYVWAPSEITPPVVSIEYEQILDFGRIVEGDPVFMPVLYSYSFNFQGGVHSGEAIRYSLQIVSDKFVSRNYQVFEVSWDGAWSSNREQMQAHLVIREITEPVPAS
jgi:hypothetical protein